MVALLGLVNVSFTGALAATSTTTLADLGLEEVIYLPTTSSQRVIDFTVPKTWRVSSGQLTLHFQHSSQLIRSKMQIILNDRLLKTIPLTKANSEQSTLTIPLSGLKQDNTLKLQVEQHYTDKCEDPVDASLWTNVLNDSTLRVNYQPKTLPISLAQYPAPLVETTTQATLANRTQVSFVVPANNQAPSQGQLQAITLLQTHLGMAAKQQTVVSNAVNELPAEGNAVIVALGKDLPKSVIATLSNAAKFANNEWKTPAGQPLAEGEAVIGIISHGAGQAMVVISANDEDGLINGARFLTHKGTQRHRSGQAMVVPAAWQPDRVAKTPKPRYINMESRTLAELGFGDQYVEKLTAPPIVFNVPVVSAIDGHSALALDVLYSYSPGLNPRYSSLEWRLNDRSIANIPLTNAGGQERLRATIPIPSELVKPHNTLVAQFHLMPDKYGFCVDNFDDQAWGKIFAKESSIRVNGHPASRLPSVGLLNSTGYPFTSPYDLTNTHLIFADGEPSLAAWNAWLSVAGRLGKSSETLATPELTTSLAADKLPKNRAVLVLGDAHDVDQFLMPVGFSNTGEMMLGGDGGELLLPELHHGHLQQGGDATGVTVLTAGNDAAYATLAALFTDNKAFQQLSDGQVIQALATDLNTESGLAVSQAVVGEGGNHSGNGSVSKNTGSAHRNGNSSYTPPQRDYGWLNIILLPIQTILDWVRMAIVWFTNLPFVSTVIYWLLWPWQWLLEVLANIPWLGGMLTALWTWFSGHIILGFIAGMSFCSITWSTVVGLFKAIVGLLFRR